MPARAYGADVSRLVLRRSEAPRQAPAAAPGCRPASACNSRSCRPAHPDRVGIIEDETAAPEKGALDDVLFIGALAPGPERVLAHRRQPPECSQVVRRA